MKYKKFLYLHRTLSKYVLEHEWILIYPKFIKQAFDVSEIDANYISLSLYKSWNDGKIGIDLFTTALIYLKFPNEIFENVRGDKILLWRIEESIRYTTTKKIITIKRPGLKQLIEFLTTTPCSEDLKTTTVYSINKSGRLKIQQH